jgi:acyl CoA:acetate/3-ketoacid CoA transferase
VPGAGSSRSQQRSRLTVKRRRILRAVDTVESIPERAAWGWLEPDLVPGGLRKRFLETGLPRGLALIHCTGIGNKVDGGLGMIGLDRLIERVVAGFPVEAIVIHPA